MADIATSSLIIPRDWIGCKATYLDFHFLGVLAGVVQKPLFSGYRRNDPSLKSSGFSLNSGIFGAYFIPDAQSRSGFDCTNPSSVR